MLNTTDELYDLVEEEDEIVAQYNFIAYYDDGIEPEDGEDDDFESQKFISYDDKFVEMFTPELESGNWFDLDRPVQDVIPVVVSQNNYGLKVGDVITFIDPLFYNEVTAEIIGVLKDNTKIIDMSSSYSENVDYRYLYRNYKFESEEKTLFITMQRDVADTGLLTQLNGNVIIKYNDYTSEETIAENYSKLGQMTTLYSTNGSIIKEGSLDYIFSQIYNLMPIFICVFILTLVGAISTSALSAKRQLRNYAVYYICGLKWKQCAVINLFSSLICILISFALSIIAAFIAKATGILGDTVISLGVWQILGCVVIMIIYVLFSIILPLNIIGNNTPNKILKSN
ncbi:MAG: hypothetical protein LUD57_02420 [Ruminococcus sp.]|nr:hypothetical protein [Ruminococcus sp.]